MLVISGLIAGYEDAGVVLEGIDLEVGAGESVALMGRNGMGKTTLLRAIMGHVRPIAGRVTFDGRDLTGRPPFVVSNAGIAYVPQGREIFTDFTVDENLLLGLLGKKGGAGRVPDAIYRRFPILAERRRQRAGTLSGGEQQQLAIAKALLTDPTLLCLDELSLGLSPTILGELFEVVRHVVAGGVTCVLVEQSLSVAAELCDRAVFLEKGAVRFDGAPGELLQRGDLARAVFLGATTR